MSASKNDIFTSSWRASPPPPPPATVHLAVSSLGRSKTTGSLWRGKVRTALGDPSDVFHPPPLQDMTPRADPLPLLVIPTQEDPTHTHPDGEQHAASSTSGGRLTSSFFDVSPKYKKTAPPLVLGPTAYEYAQRPVSPALSTSTSTLSHASTYSSNSNPSLSAALPFSPAGPMSVVNDPALLEPVELRFSPTDEFCLGVGRYSRVYLSSYRRGKDMSKRIARRSSPPASDATSLHDRGGEVHATSRIPDEEGDTWNLCAVKKLEEDEESQRLGLREAWFLRQLGSVGSSGMSHPGRARVVRLLGIKRGNDESAGVAGQGHKTRLSWPHPDLLHQALDGPKSHLRHSRHASLEDELLPIRGFASSASLRPFASTPQPEHHLVLILPFAPAVLSTIVHGKPHLLTRKQHTRLALQLAQAVSYVHSQHILHTDIKPHNVLLSSDFDVMLSDFNTAIHLPSASPPNDPAGLGTPAYSPPEFNRPPPSPFSYPADVWALGVTLMVMVVGREPYARLTSGKGRKGNGRQEMKMWLGKGAYWQWEAQERLDAEEVSPLSSFAVEFPSVERDMAEHIGETQLRKLLDGPELPVDILEVKTPAPEEMQAPKTREEEELSSYDDGSSPLSHLAAKGKHSSDKVSQRIYSLLRGMCSPSPAARPAIDSVVEVLEAEWKELNPQ